MPPLRFRTGLVLHLLLFCLAALAPADAAACPLFRSADLSLPQGATLAAAIEGLTPTASQAPVEVLEPADGALVPVDAASPLFRWRDPSARSWLVTLSVDGEPVCKGLLNTPYWVPERALWERIRADAGERTIEAVVSGVGPDGRLVSTGRTTLAVCGDPVAARISFLRKRLPFRTAQQNPNDSQVVVGDLAEYGGPRIVMQDVPICFNCHAYSLDGSTYGMDMDYKGDKGGYALVTVAEQVKVDDRAVVSWNDYVPPKPATYNMGLFTSLSPDGRYAASTVGETSAFIMLDDLSFSQMFYPATGQIAIYDARTGKVAPLPGADDVRRIQTNPSFTPDGTRLAFARADVETALVARIVAGELRKEDPHQDIHAVNAKYPVQFDLWSVPFNNGEGGTPEPIRGASDNGLSNFFPKYSPDGRWLAFTQCATGLVLQPDSKIAIVPAGGGKAHVLKANTGLMNSWHTWSPNSRWLAFASKGNSPFTEIFLTYIDDDGRSSPPLRLFRFSHEELAAMVPEFVPDHAKFRQKSMELADPQGALGKSMATDGR
ncbi:TolB family protein [Pseudodesulfovibrio karagichevae]|uniref:TolB family protein n=1 Tax=Pseudodesulfovibrio karagichevae TaxID=3239305 RepID=A0ABV4JYR3_9BACT